MAVVAPESPRRIRGRHLAGDGGAPVSTGVSGLRMSVETTSS